MKPQASGRQSHILSTVFRGRDIIGVRFSWDDECVLHYSCEKVLTNFIVDHSARLREVHSREGICEEYSASVKLSTVRVAERQGFEVSWLTRRWISVLWHFCYQSVFRQCLHMPVEARCTALKKTHPIQILCHHGSISGRKETPSSLLIQNCLKRGSGDIDRGSNDCSHRKKKKCPDSPLNLYVLWHFRYQSIGVYICIGNANTCQFLKYVVASTYFYCIPFRHYATLGLSSDWKETPSFTNTKPLEAAWSKAQIITNHTGRRKYIWWCEIEAWNTNEDCIEKTVPPTKRHS
jgi:hypothetical protein